MKAEPSSIQTMQIDRAPLLQLVPIVLQLCQPTAPSVSRSVIPQKSPESYYDSYGRPGWRF